MTIVVFAGPTLPAAEVQARLPDAIVHGPVAFGDVYLAAQARPRAIAIIDGYFERVPATWHKEILWAMAEGIHVLGASSMGALRAAELCAFGMVGVGRVFEQFRDGELEDDDEVAVVHGPAESGYLSGSEAMVNIRATLRLAEAEGVLSSESAACLIALAKQEFYAQRCYPLLFQEASAAGLPANELASLRELVETRRVDQKRLDAELLLDTLPQFLAQRPGPKRVNFTFQSTDAWHEAQRIAAARSRARVGTTTHVDEALLEELKLSGAYADTQAAATARGWALDAARRAAVKPDALALRTAVETFRRDAGLVERQAFESWRKAQRLDDAELTRFFEDQARSSWAEPLNEALGRNQLVHQLRLSGRYGELLERSRAKAQQLANLGLTAPSLEDLALTEDELWRWYFSERLGRPRPPDLDACARAAGFAGTEELRRAALREYAYRRQAHSKPEPYG